MLCACEKSASKLNPFIARGGFDGIHPPIFVLRPGETTYRIFLGIRYMHTISNKKSGLGMVRSGKTQSCDLNKKICAHVRVIEFYTDQFQTS